MPGENDGHGHGHERREERPRSFFPSFVPVPVPVPDCLCYAGGGAGGSTSFDLKKASNSLKVRSAALPSLASWVSCGNTRGRGGLRGGSGGCGGACCWPASCGAGRRPPC